MPSIRPRLLVAEPDDNRFNMLASVVELNFRVNLIRAISFDDLIAKTKCCVLEQAALPTNDSFHIDIMVNVSLPYSGLKPIKVLEATYFNQTFPLVPDASFAFIGEIDGQLEIEGRIFRIIRIPSISAPVMEIEAFVQKLSDVMIHFPLPHVHLTDPEDALLLEQIRALNPSRSLEEGKQLIARLAVDFFACGEVGIFRLGQGGSGAMVFGVAPEKNGVLIGKYVLKLCPGSSRWKINAEVEGHLNAAEMVNIEGARQYLPELRPCRFPVDDDGHGRIASYGSWHALCLSFLIDEERHRHLENVVDLETILIGSPEELASKANDTNYHNRFTTPDAVHDCRIDLWDQVFLEWLWRDWYDNGQRVEPSSAPVVLWSTRSAAAERYPPLPPYQFSARTKGYILSFLDSADARLGARFFDDWATAHDAVRELIALEGNAPTGILGLDRELHIVVGPAHGDLHASNVFLWLKHPDHPFLIDFPFYQPAGHVFQDFASLEAALIYGLMDRQSSGRGPAADPPALDHTHTQVPYWKAMQDHLLSANWNAAGPDEFNTPDAWNVALTFSLIMKLRERASTLQAHALPNDNDRDFLAEYYPALLYHTLRNIGYPSLSLFKRLLAVYSAARIISNLSIAPPPRKWRCPLTCTIPML